MFIASPMATSLQIQFQDYRLSNMLVNLVFLVATTATFCQQINAQYQKSAGCLVTLCARGYICVESQAKCYRAPCPTQTRCVPNVSGRPKPGSCPRAPYGLITTCVAGCSSDSSCPGTQKCCSWGCSRRCLTPSGQTTGTKPGKCPTQQWLSKRWYGTTQMPLYCSSDASCTGNLKCCTWSGRRRCVSPEQPAATKPGRCPNQPRGYVSTCSAQCSSDSSCYGDQKCCYSGCGRRCVSPQQQTPVTKPGSCPYTPRHFGPTCSAQCTSDSSCYGNQKCCSAGCGRRCVSPQKSQPKPGQCPQARWGSVTTCQVKCNGDSSCYGNQKCCSIGCSRMCRTPTSTTPNGKPGSCAPDSTSGYPWRRPTCQWRRDYCQSDKQCYGDLKCCRRSCGNKCEPPISIYPRPIG